MKKLILAFLILLLFSEQKLNAASNNLKGIFSGTREAIDQKPEQINNETDLKINIGPIDVSGYFHFFWSNTIYICGISILNKIGVLFLFGTIFYLYGRVP